MKEVNKAGRLDLLIDALTQKGLEYVEKKHGLSGLGEHLGPLLSGHIKNFVGQQKIDIPDEAIALYKIISMNRRGVGQ